ncbi:MAG TPA: hypothetical protein VGD98_13850 [Ktedonobacteraceae bacterium]
MVSSRRQLSPCPVCNRTDQVKKLQTASDSGELHIAPPPMPEPKATMMKYIIAGMILVGIGSFLILIMVSTTGLELIQVVITLLFIVIALLLSALAIRHIGKGDEEARQRYPVWDLAMANWNRLLYCSRDKVVFDPQIRKALSESSTRDLLDMEKLESTQGIQLVASH